MGWQRNAVADSEKYAFLEAIARNRDDTTTRLVYADWLDEHHRGEEAYAQRWMVAWKKWPLPRVPDASGKRIIKHWAWYRQSGRDDVTPDVLPKLVFLALPGVKQHQVHKLYATADEAERALVEAIGQIRYFGGLTPTPTGN
jgi:uncharacterized protein (TIGR02996 family)